MGQQEALKQPCQLHNARRSFPSPDQTGKPCFHKARKSLRGKKKKKPQAGSQALPTESEHPQSTAARKSPTLFQQIGEGLQVTGGGSESCPTPRIHSGLHTSVGLRAGGQSTTKSQQLSLQENWPKGCGSRTRPCQLIRTPGGGGAEAAGQRGSARKKYFLGSWLPSQPSSPAPLSVEN